MCFAQLSHNKETAKDRKEQYSKLLQLTLSGHINTTNKILKDKSKQKSKKNKKI